MAKKTKIELSSEEDTLESIAIAFGSPMDSEKFRTEVGRILENSEKYQGIFTLPDVSDSKEQLEEHLTVYDEAIIQKIRDEKMQLVTAEEFVGLHQEKLAAERKLEAFEERLRNILMNYMRGSF